MFLSNFAVKNGCTNLLVKSYKKLDVHVELNIMLLMKRAFELPSSITAAYKLSFTKIISAVFSISIHRV